MRKVRFKYLNGTFKRVFLTTVCCSGFIASTLVVPQFYKGLIYDFTQSPRIYETVKAKAEDGQAYLFNLVEKNTLDYEPVYDSPDENSYVIARVGYMDYYSITGEVVDGFYPVKVGNKTGYVKTDGLFVVKNEKLVDRNEPDSMFVKQYFQWDAEWDAKLVANMEFGATGCCPTAYAMALSQITHSTVAPYDVGNILADFGVYNFLGIGGADVPSAGYSLAKVFNLKVEHLKEKEAVVNSLKNGSCILINVGGSPWCKEGSYHCIMMTGYKNQDGKDMVYLKDPTRLPCDISDTWLELDRIMEYGITYTALND